MPAAVAAAVVGAVGATGAAATAISIGVNVAFSFGLSLAAAALAPSAPKPGQARQSIDSSIGPRLVYFGQSLTSPTLVYDRAVDGVRWQVWVHGHGAVPESRLISRRYNGEVRVNGSLGQLLPESRFRNSIVHSYQPGIDNQNIDVIMLSPALPQTNRSAPGWTNSHRLRGLQFSVIRSVSNSANRFQEIYINGRPPIPVMEHRAGSPYDFRTGQRVYSDNAANVFGFFMTHPLGNRLSLDDINFESFAAAADACDRLGYALSGAWDASQPPKSTFASMLAAMDGASWIDTNGKLNLSIGEFTTPDITLTSDHIISVTRLQVGAGEGEQVTEMTVSYSDRAQDYAEVQVTAARSESTEYAPQQTDLLIIPHRVQAERIGRRMFTRANTKYRLEAITNLYGLKLIGRRNLLVHLPELGLFHEPMEMDSFQFDVATGQCQVALRSIRETDFQHRPVTGASPVQVG